MQLRALANHQVPAIGLGCMNLNHAYGQAPLEDDAIALLHRAFELGVRHFDTAALYGFGGNETLVGKALKPLRKELFLASKCGMTGVDGKRVIDGRPETLQVTIDAALKRLQTDHIDLYYLHRWDKQVPIEDSVGAMARMVEQGKVGALGLSEVSATTLHRAHAEHPIAAVQTEYSLWSRNAEIAVLEACKELGAAFVAFSPLARGFLSGGVDDPDALEAKDIRRNMPRFQQPAFAANKALLVQLQKLAEEAGCSSGQLALQWLLNQGEHILPIPGTRSVQHMEENIQAAGLKLNESVLQAAGDLINQQSIYGARYPDATLAEIDTEDFV
ncbi:aldo/keto reductase [Ketobacter sp.]|jgi:aryl-alcohol dehydrogenase-like predicted oxidoreductase|nr:aldo/keto reductase [Magnetovibrio sp.]RLP52311.1 MAG: aldo/keto reductase [Ketobacter sp.]|tara:strand:- start:758 stop:1747 length:990 start_codon:yes stop_codon:yes gene_type:complete